MLSERDVSAAIGGTAYSSTGDKIGTVEHFLADDRTGAPTWVVVTTGLFGTRHSIVPATEATVTDGGLRLPVTVDAVKDAPHLAGDHLSPDEEAQLRRHYGLDTATVGAAPTWTPTAEGLSPAGADGGDVTAVATAAYATAAPPLPPPPAAYATAGDTRDETTATAAVPATEAAMTRSEEQLRIDTERVVATRVRLVKYVVTEEVQITVPIRREEIRIEEVPIDTTDDGGAESLVTDADAYGAHSAAPPAVAEETGGLPEEIILHAERPVVSVEVVPRERVRLRTDAVQGQEPVTAQVQREQIVVDETPSPGFSPR
jgi:stress response protein YsnF